MRYVFGMENKKTIGEIFNAHQRICPFCKSDNPQDLMDKYNRLQCGCGGVWVPDEPTPENMVDFIVFLNGK